MRPTTKDLARAAGVSLATVDRVLNGRPGVREETVKAVNQAIDQLGFVRNLSAANLARGRSYRFVFLLPRHGDQFLEALIARIEEARAGVVGDSILVRHLRALDEDPHQIARVIAEQTRDTVDGVAIMAPESPQVRDAINRLIERGVEVVQFVSAQSVERTVDFVGIDNCAAGATAARLLGRFVGRVVGQGAGDRGDDERPRQPRAPARLRPGADAGLSKPGGAPLARDPRRSVARAAGRRQRLRQPSGDRRRPTSSSSEARAVIEALRGVCDLRERVVIAHERTRCTEAGLATGEIDAVIAQDPGHLVRSAIRLLRARSDEREPIASQEQVRIEILIRENIGDSPRGSGLLEHFRA